jgi:hypothetical protein
MSALLPSASTMQHLVFLCKQVFFEGLPRFCKSVMLTVSYSPAVDGLQPVLGLPAVPALLSLLLPFYTHIKTVSVSSTEIPFCILCYVSPSLVSLEIYSFTDRLSIVLVRRLTHDVRDGKASGLRCLRLHGCAGIGGGEGEDEFLELELACEARSIEVLVSGEEEEVDWFYSARPPAEVAVVVAAVM